jgi:hypothetical protein
MLECYSSVCCGVVSKCDVGILDQMLYIYSRMVSCVVYKRGAVVSKSGVVTLYPSMVSWCFIQLRCDDISVMMFYISAVWGCCIQV